MRATAYCTAKAYNINALLGYFQNENRIYTLYRDVVHVNFPKQGDAFFFPYGATVFWELEKEQELAVLDEIKFCQEGDADFIEQDEFTFSYGETARIFGDEIILPPEAPLAKLAASHGLAQSVKLTIFEIAIQASIKSSQNNAQDLATRGRIILSRRDIARKMGQLLIERNNINLHVDVLDTPEIFWEYADLEPYYKAVTNYLDLPNRVTVLNKRLDIVKEFFDMLSSELNHQYSATLEWVIIILILLEVVISVMRDIMKLF